MVCGEKTVEFKNICFAYNGQKPVFEDLNLRINANQRVALTGENGAGKSTLAFMLLGFYKPHIGEILINGININEYSLESIRKNIGIISQDVVLFEGTILDNIKLGNKDATAEEVKRACENAGLTGLLMKLPKGLHTSIGKNGLNLSGGERQRVSIARVYLRNPSIIVFDEATSSLDKETEKEILDLWDRVLENKTVLVISHDDISVAKCDRVYCLDDGKII